MPVHPPPSAPAARRPLIAWAVVVVVFGALFGFAPGRFDPPPASAPAGTAQALRAAP